MPTNRCLGRAGRKRRGARHRVPRPAVPRNRAAPLDEVEPQVIRERTMSVDAFDRGQQRLHVCDLVGGELALDVEKAHSAEGTDAACRGRSLLGRWARREHRRVAPGVSRELLTEEYPEARCELDHRNPFELLAATILSAQTTDVRVNLVTPTLFAQVPDGGRPRRRRRSRAARRSSARPASTRTRRAACSAWRRRWSIASDGEVPHGARGSRDAAGGRTQDRQRGAQRGVRSPRPARSTPMSVDCRAASG